MALLDHYLVPYKTNKELPASVRKSLPQGAQTIFRKAFNNAHKQYRSEIRAFRVAWAAVKRSYYRKEHGKWAKL